jgi:1,2-diacylglycerol 3-alpha-glucosyltransferase
MRIAIFTNNYLPNPYGVTMSIESFRKEYERLGHTVYVFAPKAGGYHDENPNVFRYPSIDINYKISFPLGIPFSRRISKKLNELEIDIIHSQHPNLIGWAAKKWAKKKNVPLVFTWHTLYDQYAHFAPPFIPKKIAAWWTIGNAVGYANSADQVIVPTPSVKPIIEKWGMRNRAVLAVPTGIDEMTFDGGDREKIRKRYSIRSGEIVLVWVARFTNEKNTEFLFRSVLGVLKKNSNIRFLAGGDGHMLDEMKKLVKDSGLEDRVIMPGFVTNDEKNDYYAAGDIYVNASKSETQGIIIAEAMYMGLPVVAVSATGVKDLVMNHITGLLVSDDEESFAKAVEKLSGDDGLRKRFSENSKKIARQQYVSSVCAERMLSVYRDVIERKARRDL